MRRSISSRALACGSMSGRRAAPRAGRATPAGRPRSRLQVGQGCRAIRIDDRIADRDGAVAVRGAAHDEEVRGRRGADGHLQAQFLDVDVAEFLGHVAEHALGLGELRSLLRVPASSVAPLPWVPSTVEPPRIAQVDVRLGVEIVRCEEGQAAEEGTHEQRERHRPRRGTATRPRRGRSPPSRSARSPVHALLDLRRAVFHRVVVGRVSIVKQSS